MGISLCALLLAADLPLSATLVVFQWTPERILLAADSLTARVHESGEIEDVNACKIHQQGNIFFTIVGINDDSDAKVDLVALASQAARSSGNLRGVVRSFEGAAGGGIRRLWDDVVKHRSVAARMATGTDGAMSISIIFVSRKEHAIAVKEYSGNTNGAVSESPARFYGSGTGMRQDRGYVAIGVYADAQAASSTNRQLAGLEGVPFLNTFFQVQIAHEIARAKQHAAPRIAAPVCILEIMSGAAQWVTAQKGGGATNNP